MRMAQSYRSHSLGVVLALTITGFALAATPATADKPEATELEKVRAYVQPSIVYLGLDFSAYVYDTFNKDYISNEPISVGYQCTGYVVNPNGYIATAGHCVTPGKDTELAIRQAAAALAIESGYYKEGVTVDQAAADFELRNQDGKAGNPELSVYAAWGVAAGGIRAGQSYAARVVEAQEFEKGDAALLKTEAKNLQAIKLVDTEPEVGKEIVSIGYPASVDRVTDLNFDPSFKDGSVSSKKSTAGGLFKTYEISAAMSGGMSGGPTVDLDHGVVGFNSFGILGEEQQFNFVRPSTLTMEVMSDAGVKNVIGEVGRNYNDGLDAYFAGDRDQAIESLQKVLDKQPSNEMAQEFIEKAQQLDKGTGAAPIVLLGLVVVAAGAGVYAVVRRRRIHGRQSVGSVGSAIQQPAMIKQTTASPQGPAESATEGRGPVASTAVLEPEAKTAEPVADAAARPKYCPSCGDEVRPDEKFCDNCGTRLD